MPRSSLIENRWKIAPSSSGPSHWQPTPKKMRKNRALVFAAFVLLLTLTTASSSYRAQVGEVLDSLTKKFPQIFSRGETGQGSIRASPQKKFTLHLYGVERPAKDAALLVAKSFGNKIFELDAKVDGERKLIETRLLEIKKSKQSFTLIIWSAQCLKHEEVLLLDSILVHDADIQLNMIVVTDFGCQQKTCDVTISIFAM